jgi:hypothetical protein
MVSPPDKVAEVFLKTDDVSALDTMFREPSPAVPTVTLAVLAATDRLSVDPICLPDLIRYTASSRADSEAKYPCLERDSDLTVFNSRRTPSDMVATEATPPARKNMRAMMRT